MQVPDCHCISLDEIAAQLDTDFDRGLSPEEAAERLKRRGPNELLEKPRPGLLQTLAGQFNNFLVILLILAAVISLLLGEYVDAAAILFIVVLNAIVGGIQESKAEAALAALKKMAAPNAQVIRDGRQMTISSRYLAPGDIVLLEAGNYVPADMRLIESMNFKVEEASLTGESAPVEKDAGVVLEEDIPLGDRKNSVFMSTLVTYGRGKGVVTATGMHTQMGMIAEMLQSYEDASTPLQKKLNQLAKVPAVVCLIVCSVIFAYGLIRDSRLSLIVDRGIMAYLRAESKDIVELFMTAVSLAIAAVPEGLPAVVTICLALGMQRMIRRHALIRKLSAVETLGCATVICSDKTGTLTQNEMTVTQVWAGGTKFNVTGEGYDPVGRYLLDDKPCDPSRNPGLSLLLRAAALCNDARIEENRGEKGDKSWRMIGDPTEGAMVVAAAKAGLWPGVMDKSFPRIQEIPFDSDRKRMTTIHYVGDDADRLAFPPSGVVVALMKGAPDIILGLCSKLSIDGREIPLSEDRRHEIVDVNRDMAKQALRVLGIACKKMESLPEALDGESIERDMTFIGLMGMIDPARSEVKEAVRIAHEAGLKSVMVTGDYKETAEAIAREIGIFTPGGRVLTGAEIDKMSDVDLAGVIDEVDVCCRVSPAHKTKIVDAFKKKGHVVAMTGDGVNDAPALKRADIGVAMGITGTDVSKETADMVLTDDNFASIVSAIEEGRIIYANIRKFVYFLISCNIGEILIIFLSMLFGMPIPLRPAQLLLLNLVTDGGPALALAMEKGDPDIMKRPPRSSWEPVINRKMRIGTVVQATVMTFAVLMCYHIGLGRYPHDISHAQTMAFATLCMSELARVFTARSEHYGIVSIGIFSNRYMMWAVAGSGALVLAVIYIPYAQRFLDTVPLSAGDWMLMIPFIFMDSIAAETTKVFFRKEPANQWSPADLPAFRK